MSTRPRICAGTDIHRILDELDEVIGTSDPRIYQRTGSLCLVRGILAEDAKRLGIAFAPDDLMMAPLKRETLLPAVSEHAHYGAEVKLPDGGTGWKSMTPTGDVTAAFLGKRFWAHIRPIRGISKTPIIHLDGSITPEGYDPETRYLVATSIEVRHVWETVTQADASTAMTALLEPFAEFHFASPAARYAAAALILTILLRPVISGNVPIFLFRAPQKDCGKSLVAKAACLIATGSIPGANTWAGEGEEQEKVLSSIATASLPVAFFDNVGTGSTIGGAALDKVSTCDGETSFRVLGKTETRSLPWTTTIVFTSNRARVDGDTDRRCLAAELTRREEEVSEFAHPDLLAYCREHRARLLGAAFTVIRGWVQAGKPVEGCRRLNSFEAWGRTVPPMIKWATGGAVDVRELVLDAQGTDTDEIEFRLLEALYRYQDVYRLEATTVKALVGRVYAAEVGGGAGDTSAQRDAKADLREAIDALECTSGKGDSAQLDRRKLGKRLSAMADVYYPPFRLERAGAEDHLVRWRVTRSKVTRVNPDPPAPSSPSAPETGPAYVNGNGAGQIAAIEDGPEYLDDILSH